MKTNSLIKSQHVEMFARRLKEAMAKPNMFIIPYDPGDQASCTQIKAIVDCLQTKVGNVVELTAEPSKLPLSADLSSLIFLKCIAVDSGKPETIRDIIKEFLWSRKNTAYDKPSFCDIISGNKTAVSIPFNLSDYGIFVPYRITKEGDIRIHSFNHKPVFYRYRMAVPKTPLLPESLLSYLHRIFTDCPNHLFNKSNFRASARLCDELNIHILPSHNRDHELIRLATESSSFEKFKSRHENLQMFLLLNDPHTIACEVPVWLESNELSDYEKVFRTEDMLTGHIDVLRYEQDGKIGVWDYKPMAAEEVDAKIQVFLYTLMLSVRTGINFKDFVCGYFDETDAFSFIPSAST